VILTLGQGHQVRNENVKLNRMCPWANLKRFLLEKTIKLLLYRVHGQMTSSLRRLTWFSCKPKLWNALHNAVHAQLQVDAETETKQEFTKGGNFTFRERKINWDFNCLSFQSCVFEGLGIVTTNHHDHFSTVYKERNRRELVLKWSKSVTIQSTKRIQNHQ